jgi:hypothetical protein
MNGDLMDGIVEMLCKGVEDNVLGMVMMEKGLIWQVFM